MPEQRFGRAIWPGVRGFISCSYTCSHGITPGIASLTVPDQDVSKIQPYGTLVITDGFGTVALPRCKVVDVQFSGGGGSPRLLTLHIADRRWMWAFGRINGNWNQLDPYPDPDSFPPDEFTASGGPYMPGTFRLAANLMADCLDALNETTPFIDPAPIIPLAVQWDDELPAHALQQVAETLGYKVVYQPAFDRVLVALAGVGYPLPNLPTISGSIGIDPPERPNAFQLVGGDTLFSDYLELEPVTLELNGKIVELDDASYKPQGGWGRATPPNFSQVYVEFGPEKCALAKQHVWRTFRVKMRDVTTGKAGIEVPQFGKVADRKQIVLGNQIYGLTKDERGQFMTEPARAVGSVFYPFAFDRPVDGANISLGAFGNTVVGQQRIPVRPSIDTARGLVTFDRHLFRNAAVDALGVSIPSPQSGWCEAPKLYLYTSFRLRNLAGMVFNKFQAAGVSPVTIDPLCPPETIRHPELVAVVRVNRNASKGFRIDEVTDNLNDLKAAADYYLNAADQKYRVEARSERTYAGIHPISPDGAIQQVTWSVGGGPATTQASRNSEHSVFIPPFPERRRKEQLINFWGKAIASAGSSSNGGGGLAISPGKLNEIILGTIGIGPPGGF